MLDKGTSCGFLACRPRWLQRFAAPKFYMIVFTLIAIVSSSVFSYMSVVLSTIEKRFGLQEGTQLNSDSEVSYHQYHGRLRDFFCCLFQFEHPQSKEAAWIFSGNEISQILLMLILPFAGKVKRRPLWLGVATVVSAVGVLISAIPHFTGRQQITSTDGAKSVQLCGDTEKEDDECEVSNQVKDLGSIAIIFFGQVLFGLVNALFWIFGMTYADDNTTRANSPFQVALSMAGRVTGPTLGYFLGALCLKINSEPQSGFDESDPRWIGAWWVGFVVVGALLMMLGPFLTLFPATLPLEKSDGMSQRRARMSGRR